MFIRSQLLLLLFFFCFSFVNAQPKKSAPARPLEASQALSKFELEIISELNLLRRKPAEYLKIVEEQLKKYNGNYLMLGNRTQLETIEGKKPLEELIPILKEMKPAPEFALSNGLTKATRDHMNDLEKNDTTGHIGQSGEHPQLRAEKYGAWAYDLRENISYGATTPRDVVLNFLIDDGIASRSHRKNVLNPKFTKVGIASGVNRVWNPICVLLFAGDFFEKKGKGLRRVF